MKHWSEDTNWLRLSDAVESLKREAEAAYFACNEDAASQAHDDLISAEWRLRIAERRRDRG